MELWNREHCPSCKKANWFYYGDPEDQTLPDHEGYLCFYCSHKWICADREDLELMYLDEDQVEAGARVEDHIHYEKGRETP